VDVPPIEQLEEVDMQTASLLLEEELSVVRQVRRVDVTAPLLAAGSVESSVSGSCRAMYCQKECSQQAAREVSICWRHLPLLCRWPEVSRHERSVFLAGLWPRRV